MICQSAATRPFQDTLSNDICLSYQQLAASIASLRSSALSASFPLLILVSKSFVMQLINPDVLMMGMYTVEAHTPSLTIGNGFLHVSVTWREKRRAASQENISQSG